MLFERYGRLPEGLCPVPEPDTQLRQLTEAIADRWPEAPPYGGRFAEIVPHLTIAQGREDAVLEEIEADLTGGLTPNTWTPRPCSSRGSLRRCAA